MYIQIKCRVVSQGLGNLVYVCIKPFRFSLLFSFTITHFRPHHHPFTWRMKSEVPASFEAVVVSTKFFFGSGLETSSFNLVIGISLMTPALLYLPSHLYTPFGLHRHRDMLSPRGF
ncbi:Hypothetical predicted protein [Podarcis lilfordi]|uniref:Uncharacterized protein n=1 Tax=Podarcis lilfordi TaxID=74358 RepID=A0AA35KXW8_9SAUR|nr:Hypothetical predicted protein [Podarcis lilfordi]